MLARENTMQARSSATLISLLGVAIACATPGAARAQSNEELLRELKALKERVGELEKKLADKPTPTPAEAQWGMTPAQVQDFNRIAMKTEALEDAIEAQGLRGLKVSGMLDPTFVFDQRRRTGSAVFLNNFSGDDSFAYDNSYFGMAVIDFQKELEGGTRWRLTLAPHKSVGSNYNFPSIVHEASVSIPVGDLATRVWAGQVPDWSGYENYFANQTPFVTHGMMFDFLAPAFYTAVGTDITRGKWQVKTALGNMNAARYKPGADGASIRSPLFSARVDYSKGEFDGWGSALQIGKTANTVTGGASVLHNLEVDGYYIRGDLTIQGQLNLGGQKDGAFNGGDSRWWGGSGLVGYKITPRFGLAGRADYIANSRHGGGNFNIAFPTCGEALCPDGRNGFGPGMVQDAASGAWSVGDPDRGANRYALSVAARYALTANAVLKMEYRLDGADLPVFLDLKDGSYHRSNQLLGAAVVVSF
jgi:hypothetical protein